MGGKTTPTKEEIGQTSMSPRAPWTDGQKARITEILTNWWIASGNRPDKTLVFLDFKREKAIEVTGHYDPFSWKCLGDHYLGEVEPEDATPEVAELYRASYKELMLLGVQAVLLSSDTTYVAQAPTVQALTPRSMLFLPLNAEPELIRGPAFPDIEQEYDENDIPITLSSMAWDWVQAQKAKSVL